MSLICNYRKAFAFCCGEFTHLLKREGECLDRADDDLFVSFQCTRELCCLSAAFALDGGDNTFGPLQIEHCILQLPIDHFAVAYDQNRVEHLLVICAVQLR